MSNSVRDWITAIPGILRKSVWLVVAIAELTMLVLFFAFLVVAQHIFEPGDRQCEPVEVAEDNE